MAALSTIALVATAAVSIGSAYETHRQGQKAEDAQKESARIAGNQSQIERQNERRQQIRQERVRRAQIMQASETAGVSGSSGEVGSTGALASITGGNVASSFQADRTSQRLTTLGNKVASAQKSQQTAGAIGGVAGTVFSSLGGASALAGSSSQSGPNVDDQVTKLVGTSGLF